MNNIFHQYKYFIILLSFTASYVESNAIIMKLKQCPDSPNCVSSQSLSSDHLISPIPYKSPPIEAKEQIKKIILAMPHTHLIKEDDQYLHIEIKTNILKFVDDIEIIIDDVEKLIHLRSASRVGHWDLGANRRRVNNIRRKYTDSSF